MSTKRINARQLENGFFKVGGMIVSGKFIHALRKCRFKVIITEPEQKPEHKEKRTFKNLFQM